MMNRKSLLMWLLIPLLSLQACSPVENARIERNHGRINSHVILYSHGQAIKEWHAEGRIETDNSGHTYFVDRNTKKLVDVSGTVVIESE